MKNLPIHRVIRFVAVGTANAAISLGVLNLMFYKFHHGKVVSSIIATSCALIFSFILNRNFVFADKSRRIHKQALPFVIVTVSGSLLVLNLVYIMALRLLNNHEQPIINIVHSLTGIDFSKNFVDINLATALGAVVAMLWNYNGYRLFVFKAAMPEMEEPNED